MALTKIDDRGLKTPIDLLDNEKIRLGTGNDLELFHDGSHSIIEETGTGALKLVTNSSFQVRNDDKDTGEYLINANVNGSAELYYNGLKSLYTDSLGVSVKGGDTSSKTQLSIFGNEGQRGVLQISADDGDDNADHWQLQARTDGNLNIQNLNSGSWGNSAVFKGGGSVELYNDNVKRLWTTSTGSAIAGTLNLTGDIQGTQDNLKLLLGGGNDLQIYHDGSHNHIRHGVANQNLYIEGVDNEAGTPYIYLNPRRNQTGLSVKANQGVDLYYDNVKKLATASGGISVAGYVNVESGEHVYLADNGKILAGTSSDFAFYHNGTNSYIDNNLNNIYIRNNVDGDDGGNIYIEAKSGETSIECSDDSFVSLYWDGTKKFETFEWGTITQGICKMVGASGGAAQVYLFADNESVDDRWRIDAEDGGVLQIQSMPGGGSWENAIKCYYNAQVELYHNNNLKLTTTSSGVTVTGSVSTNDINLSNLNASPNEVDGTQGSWTMQEGANDLFLINRSNGKKYKFNLTEIS